jgi:Glycosyltransferase
MVGKNILIVGQQSWDSELGSNCKDIAAEFSKRNRVLYVNPPLDRISWIRRKHDDDVRRRLAVIAGREADLRPINDNMWLLYPNCIVESINWLDSEWIFDLLNKWNSRRFASAIKRHLSTIGFDEGFILFNDNEIMRCLYLKELLNPTLTVYYSRDYIVAAPYWNKRGARLEPVMIRKSDICFSNSLYLTNYCKQYNENSHYVGQGYDNRLFRDLSDVEMPQELISLRHPIIGYVGVLHSSRLDIEAMLHIAQCRPDWTLVLVGPEDAVFRTSELHQQANVIFVGMKSMTELARYIYYFDVCINPQFLTPLTVGNYPRKVDEYLAMGKPVVAFATHAMQAFASHTYLAENKEEYVDLIQRALNEDSPKLREERKKFVVEHTWERSVEAMYAILLGVDITVK